MKKLSRIICIALSMIMVLGAFGMLIACKKNPKMITITYQQYNEDTEVFDDLKIVKVAQGQKVNYSSMPDDPVPTETKVFDFWSEDGEKDFFAGSAPQKDVTLKAVFRDRKANEIVAYFETGGAGRIPSQTFIGSGKVTKPGNPTLKGSDFVGWLFDFDKTITEDTRIIAEWQMGSGKVMVLNSAAFDGVFSPFFSTSSYDGSVHGMTQISMLGANRSGKVYVGEDVPTLVKDYNVTTYYKGVPHTGDVPAGDRNNGEEYYSEYEFVIKNGVKDSQNVPLTIKDVLFNMYVYLDPSYTGSSTMYSTNIIGLNAYRTQNPDAEDGISSGDSTASSNAKNRMFRLRNYFDRNNSAATRPEYEKLATEKEILTDAMTLRMMLWEELLADWNALGQLSTKEEGGKTVIEGYEDYGFQHKWEVFLFNCGIITAEYNNDGKVKEEDGVKKIEYNGSEDWYHEAPHILKIAFNTLAGVLGSSEVGNMKPADAGNFQGDAKYPIIDLQIDPVTHKLLSQKPEDVGGSKFPFGDYTKTDDRDIRINKTFVSRVLDISVSKPLLSNLVNLTNYWSCGQRFTNEVLASEKNKILLEKTVGGRSVDRIKGITAAEGITTFTNIDGKTKTYSEPHDVLKVRIVGIDPKAIWNFAVSIAPMHYYSNPVGKANQYQNDGYEEFKYPGVDGEPSEVDDNYVSHLGFKQLDLNYFKEVMKHSSVIDVPVGAGPFKATDLAGTNYTTTTPAGSSFFSNNVVYFKRNDHFKTTGESMNNAKFEFLRYQVVDATKVLESIKNGEVDFGDPAAKEENLSAQDDPSLETKLVTNNGYGYVGVNAKWVPDLEIRQAIMTAMNKEIIKSYYPEGLATIINRSMSIVSPYYPTEDSKDVYEYKNRDAAKEKIIALVAAAGYSANEKTSDGTAYQKTNLKTNEKINLKFLFTVAGSTTDHPAFNMFVEAANLLNECGFNVTVKNDVQALSKLSNGQLEVWAAAWSSAIDPDMFQVYHPDSQAQSVNNWGYPYLLQNRTTTEEKIMNDLAARIEEGRQTNNFEDRKTIYRAALNEVMKLAVEYPTYQRENLYVYNKNKINPESVNKRPTAYQGLIDEIWKVSLF